MSSTFPNQHNQFKGLEKGKWERNDQSFIKTIKLRLRTNYAKDITKACNWRIKFQRFLFQQFKISGLSKDSKIKDNNIRKFDIELIQICVSTFV